jgi:MFS transporter, MCT family, solute carrier family 16 (monocarboxylic acid transporters), member 10
VDRFDTSKYLLHKFPLLIILLLQYSLIFLPGLPMGRLFDKGYFKLPLLCASVILVGATFIIAECKEYWEFLLVQGFVTGLACGVIFGPAIGAVATYCECTRGGERRNLMVYGTVHRRRNLAFGVVAAGTSIGGTIFPLIARSLLPRVG